MLVNRGALVGWSLRKFFICQMSFIRICFPLVFSWELTVVLIEGIGEEGGKELSIIRYY